MISGTVTILGFLVAYFKWKREVDLKIGEIKKEVTSEVIKQRFIPFSNLMIELEVTSSIHKSALLNESELRQKVTEIFQNAIYGKVGLFASHETRQILVIARLTSEKFEQQPGIYEDWRRVVWAAILALRNDLGIPQPRWDNVLDEFQNYKPENVSNSGSFGDRWVGGNEVKKLLARISNIRNEMREE